MSKQYREMIEAFFDKYGERRREWLVLLAQWKENRTQQALQTKVEGLMAQIEESHSAAKMLLASSEPDTARVERLFHQMKKCYDELHEVTKPEWRQWVETIVKTAVAVFFIRTYIFGHYHVPTGSAEPNLLVGDHLWVNKAAYVVSRPTHGELVVFNDQEFVYDKNPLQKWWQEYIGFNILGILKQGPMNVVKRVIACPGDTIEGRMEDGCPVTYLNGEKLEETYRNPYPLIVLKKEVGFFDPHGFPGMLMPWFLSFLNKQVKEVRYTYDPSVSLDEQPFYHMEADEVMRNPFTKDPLLLMPNDPSIEYRRGRNVDVFGPLVVPQGKYWVQGDSRRNSRDSRFWMFVDEAHLLGRASFIIYSLDSEEFIWIMALLKNPIAFFTQVIRWNRFFCPLWNIPDLRLKPLPADETEKGAVSDE